MDRYFRGLISGIIGGIAMNLWALVVLFILQWEIIRFVDWAGIFLFGDLPRSHLQGAISLGMHIIFVGFLGVVFAFLIPQVTSRGYLLKGVSYGVITGLFIYAIPTLFQMPILAEHSTATVVSNIIGGIIWGLTMAQALRWLDRKAFVK